MSFGLMTGCLAGGVAVSNERGVFVPPHSVREAFEATARAFAAIAAPPGQLQLQLQPYNLLFNPGYIDTARLPDQIAQRILNPAPPVPNNPFPGVFPSGAASAPGNTNSGSGPGETAGLTDTPPSGGTAEVPSDVPGLVAPTPIGGGNGFSTVPVPVQEVATTPPTTPGETAGTTPTTPGGETTTPGGGTTPPDTGTTTNPGGTTTPGGTTPPTTGGTTTTPGGETTTPGGGTPTTGGGTTTPGGGTTTTPGGGTTTTPGGGTTTPTNPTPPCIGAVCQPINPPGNPPILPEEPGVPTSAVPEPSNWAMLILGFGIVGGLQRWVGRKKRAQTV